jgi:hypothetical protein
VSERTSQRTREQERERRGRRLRRMGRERERASVDGRVRGERWCRRLSVWCVPKSESARDKDSRRRGFFHLRRRSGAFCDRTRTRTAPVGPCAVAAAAADSIMVPFSDVLSLVVSGCLRLRQVNFYNNNKAQAHIILHGWRSRAASTLTIS